MSTNQSISQQGDTPTMITATSNYHQEENLAHGIGLAEAWFTEVGTAVYIDKDGDGFFTGLSISFRTSTDFNAIDVICVVNFTSQDYLFAPFHISEPFTVNSHGSYQQQIELELLEGIPADRYDISLELRDPWSHRTLDIFTAGEVATLRHIPLESQASDYHGHGSQLHGTGAIQYSATLHGAALDYWLLVLLLPCLLLKRYRR